MKPSETRFYTVEIAIEFPPELLREATELYVGAQWISDAGQGGFLEQALRNSGAVAVAWNQEHQLIGMARALSDMVSDAYIQDVVVRPDFRRIGVGGALVKTLISELRRHQVDWIGLIGVPGTEHFYNQLGFTAQRDHTFWRWQEKTE